MKINLSGKRVLVVGATGGIGSATVKAFADAGAKVSAAARPGPKLTAVAMGANVEALALDILDENAVEKAFRDLGIIDHLIIAAAATKSGSVAGLALADAKASMESKFWGAYRISRVAQVVEDGSITFVSGFLSTRPSGGAVLQGSINAALEALGRGLALERAPVRVNTVSPGLIDTPLWSGLPPTSRDEMFAKAAGRLPVRRIGKPEDVAAAIFFLATNPFATGTTVTVDGGGTIA